jgi:hypothetical protein
LPTSLFKNLISCLKDNQQFYLFDTILIWVPEKTYIYKQYSIEKKNIFIISYKNLFSVLSYLQENMKPSSLKLIMENYNLAVKEKAINNIPEKILLLKSLMESMEEKILNILLPNYNPSYQDMLVMNGASENNFLLMIKQWEILYNTTLFQKKYLIISCCEQVTESSGLSMKTLPLFPLPSLDLSTTEPLNQLIISFNQQEYKSNSELFFLHTLIHITSVITFGISGRELEKLLDKLLKQINNFEKKNQEILHNLLFSLTIKDQNIQEEITYTQHLFKIINLLKKEIKPKGLQGKIIDIMEKILGFQYFFLGKEELHHMETIAQDSLHYLTILMDSSAIEEKHIGSPRLLLNSIIFTSQQPKAILHKNSPEKYVLQEIGSYDCEFYYYQEKKNIQIEESNLNEIIAFIDKLSAKTPEKIPKNNEKSLINLYSLMTSLEDLLFAPAEAILLMVLGGYNLQNHSVIHPKTLEIGANKTVIHQTLILDLEFYNSLTWQEKQFQLKITVPVTNIYLNGNADGLLNIFILVPSGKGRDYYYQMAHLLYFLIKKQRKNLNFHEVVYLLDQESREIILGFNCNNSGYYLFNNIENKLQNFLYLIAIGGF